ncbi:MAG: hypothetical protein NT027_03080, partial [Proteobacteria bacterium]|nr:hypothetical protein [Pseudomonadota bacterium]
EYGASMSIGKKFTGFSMGSLELTSQGPESSLYFGATVGGLFRYRQIQADVRSSWLANPIGRGDNRKIYSSVGIATPISMQQALSVFLKKTCLSQSNWCVSDYDLDFKFYF